MEPKILRLVAEGRENVRVTHKISVNKDGVPLRDEKVRTLPGRNLDGQIRAYLRKYCQSKQNKNLTNIQNYSLSTGFLPADKQKFENLLKRCQACRYFCRGKINFLL